MASIFLIMAEAKAANEAGNPVDYKGKNVFVTHYLWTHQAQPRPHNPTRKKKESVMVETAPYQYHASGRFARATSFKTVASIMRDGGGLAALKAAAGGHDDAIFKTFIDIWAFRDHYLCAEQIEDAIYEAEPPGDRDLSHWAKRRQHPGQFTTLG